MVFGLSALWWRRIRGLWNLPDGRNCLRGKLGLVLMSRAMLSQTLMQFSVDGWSCVPSLLFACGQTMVEVMEITVTSYKRSHACTATLSAPNHVGGHRRPKLPLENPGHWQASPCQSLVGSLLLSPGFWCTRFCLCPPRIYFSVLYKFSQLYGGINGDLLQESCHTQVCCTQSPCPCHRTLLTRPPQEMLTGLPQSPWGPWVPVHKICLSPLSVSDRNGVWF